MTKEERNFKNQKQREYRANNNNACTRKYEKTFKGFAMRLYRNMQSRVTGVQWRKSHLYQDLTILPREQFYEWILSSETFKTLFKAYEESGYSRRLAPSVDRIDSSKGYELSNMEIVTMSENSRRGTMSKNNKRTNN